VNDRVTRDEGDDETNSGEVYYILVGGTGRDTFICHCFNQLIDFNIEEGDKIKGSCEKNQFRLSIKRFTDHEYIIDQIILL
ncbi:MAG: hypothetical protein R3321_06255, partial [Nitrososphaeraceae archaeon]|nr:hypothetical protein [Nitrososphaeraceae archaeon]